MSSSEESSKLASPEQPSSTVGSLRRPSVGRFVWLRGRKLSSDSDNVSESEDAAEDGRAALAAAGTLRSSVTASLPDGGVLALVREACKFSQRFSAGSEMRQSPSSLADEGEEKGRLPAVSFDGRCGPRTALVW
eukprot:scaffold1108_cov260-Pinguiococcus_pyrenoidosus.AAC.2